MIFRSECRYRRPFIQGSVGPSRPKSEKVSNGVSGASQPWRAQISRKTISLSQRSFKAIFSLKGYFDFLKLFLKVLEKRPF